MYKLLQMPLYFNPRAPCGARRSVDRHCRLACSISTHAPLAGRDYSLNYELIPSQKFQPTRPLRGATSVAGYSTPLTLIFQPTRPLRGATYGLLVFCSGFHISTHAPLAGRDGGSIRCRQSQTYFNPRAPCGARRRRWSTRRSRTRHFNPRAPCGARPAVGCSPMKKLNFNPRAPCGARRWTVMSQVLPSLFQPTRPLRGATA